MRLFEQEARVVEALGAGWLVRVYDEVASTMQAAREAVEDSRDGEHVLALALKQRQGRGRQGRQWESPEGGFYGTYAFRTASEPDALSGFSLATGVAVCKALGLTKNVCTLKWPNDILARDGRKLGGILIEVFPRGGHRHVLAGVGINLSGGAVTETNAASLDVITNRHYAPCEVAQAIGRELAKTFSVFVEKGLAAFREEWLEKAAHIGSCYEIDTGTERVEGSVLGIREDGALLLDVNGTARAVVTGHVVRIYAAGDRCR